MTDSPSVANILAVYRGAPSDLSDDGMDWYINAHNVAREMANKYGISVSQAAGIIAALSPMNQWDNNKAKAIQLCEQGGFFAVYFDEKGKEKNGIGLPDNVRKASAIFFGWNTPEEVLGGDKVNAFYRTILDPFGYVRPTVDRHAFDIAVGERTDNKRRGILSRKGMYEIFADAYIEAARIEGISAPQMQARTWVIWKDAHGIL
jgi:hypothetical protein